MSRYTADVSFLGQRTPKEVKLLSKTLKNVKKDAIASSIEKVVQYIRDKTPPDFSSELDTSRSNTLFGGFYCILTRALGCRDLQRPAFVKGLQELNFNSEVIESLADVLYNSATLSLTRGDDTPLFREVDWRLDVVLSNNSLAKVLQPEVLLGLKMTDSSEVKMQLSPQQFHALRQSTAKVLHDMFQLRERKFMNT